jgi:hypothetical protein
MSHTTNTTYTHFIYPLTLRPDAELARSAATNLINRIRSRNAFVDNAPTPTPSPPSATFGSPVTLTISPGFRNFSSKCSSYTGNFDTSE